ncbi:UTRA domain-containing protein [Actinomadura luteofluorescens]|uniref:UTRA domain-containing protein n=1 Tax=Actinomadura luteofluorescens TaxID=46163 RepID=UPI002164E723|nr:UTRA domain-containing protein [Actinomadura glauciflava]
MNTSSPATRPPWTGPGVGLLRPGAARMRVIGQHIESVQEVVTARPVLQSEAELLGEALGSVVMVIQRTYRTAERAVETADIVVPTDRYEVEYVLPVE